MHKLIERISRDVKTDTQSYSNPDTTPSTENHEVQPAYSITKLNKQ